jgi:hypothetical protein
MSSIASHRATSGTSFLTEERRVAIRCHFNKPFRPQQNPVGKGWEKRGGAFREIEWNKQRMLRGTDLVTAWSWRRDWRRRRARQIAGLQIFDAGIN